MGSWPSIKRNFIFCENLDKKLSATSALMSFSTIWDMVCTFPVLFYVVKGLAILTVPAATAGSLLILAMSNAAENLHLIGIKQ